MFDLFYCDFCDCNGFFIPSGSSVGETHRTESIEVVARFKALKQHAAATCYINFL